jgi:hypothetical protein
MVGPVGSAAREQARHAAVEAAEHPVTVELDLVQPAVAARRL